MGTMKRKILLPAHTNACLFTTPDVLWKHNPELCFKNVSLVMRLVECVQPAKRKMPLKRKILLPANTNAWLFTTPDVLWKHNPELCFKNVILVMRLVECVQPA